MGFPVPNTGCWPNDPIPPAETPCPELRLNVPPPAGEDERENVPELPDRENVPDPPEREKVPSPVDREKVPDPPEWEYVPVAWE